MKIVIKAYFCIKQVATLRLMMKYLGILVFFGTMCHCGESQVRPAPRVLGNNIREFVQDKNNPGFFDDPVDDTVNFKWVVDDIYQDTSGKVLYLLTSASREYCRDTFMSYEYYKNVSDFIDLKTYGKVGPWFFKNKGKVYYWWYNSDGEYPVNITGADGVSFVQFDSLWAGRDKQHVFNCGYENFGIVEGADPKTTRVLEADRCCGVYYFVDRKNVYFGLKKIEGADAASFRIVNQDKVDAEDKNGKYFDGNLVR